jgi:hypothetical protein
LPKWNTIDGLQRIVENILNAKSAITCYPPKGMERQNIEKVYVSMEVMSYIEIYTLNNGYLEQTRHPNENIKRRMALQTSV